MTNQESLSLLVARWRDMAEIREGLAQERRDAGEITAAIGYESGAQCYHRCADELQTFMAGYTPPPVGHVWNVAEAMRPFPRQFGSQVAALLDDDAGWS